MEQKTRRTVVIGGGASGCMAAIAAAQAGADVLLLEKNEKLAKKIYATGNGRCNLTNLYMDASCYHTQKGGEDLPRIMEAVSRFSPEDLLSFFEDLGVFTHDRDGYVYPRTDQAETIARALEKKIRSLGIQVLTRCCVTDVERDGDIFLLRVRREAQKKNRTEKKTSALVTQTFQAQAVILCTGGMAAPSFGSTGDGYRFAAAFSHHLVPPLPALTQLECRCPHLKRAAGVRCAASVTLAEKTVPPKVLAVETGELQITEYGISGIPVMQLSAAAARALHAGQTLFVRIDFLPWFQGEELFAQEIRRRLGEDRNQMLGDLFLGLTHKKAVDLLLSQKGLQAEMKAKRFSQKELEDILRSFRAFDMDVLSVRSFTHAQVTSGGIPLSEIRDTFSSKYQQGLYMAGELLDVDGRCGGYNLQWAMTSGFLAGTAAANG